MYKARECLSEVCAIFLEIFVLIRYFQSQYWCLPNLETWRSTSVESEVFPKTTPYSVAQSCLPQKAHTATTDQPLSPTALINRDGCTGREGINGVCQQKTWMEGSEGSRSGLLCQAFQLPWTPQPTPKISKAHTSKSNPILQSIYFLDFLEKRYLDVVVGMAVRSNVEMSHTHHVLILQKLQLCVFTCFRYLGTLVNGDAFGICGWGCCLLPGIDLLLVQVPK